jgi:hypothetical protein
VHPQRVGLRYVYDDLSHWGDSWWDPAVKQEYRKKKRRVAKRGLQGQQQGKSTGVGPAPPGGDAMPLHRRLQAVRGRR